MTSKDVAQAVNADTNANSIIHLALAQVLPILRALAKKGRWWQKWGMNALVNAVEGYLISQGWTF